MTKLTRRSLLAGTAAAVATGAAGAAPQPAMAAQPVVGKQAPGFYRYKVGSFEVTVVTDGVNRMKLPDDMVANASRDEVNAALLAAHMEKDVFVGPYNPIVVNTGSKLVLIDTGTGEAAYKSSNGVNGQLLTNLAAAGLDPAAFDAVIISHFHGDHVNGLLKADGSLAFPNAEVLVPAKEHTYWMDDGEMSRAPKGRQEGLFKNNRRVFSGEVMKRVRTYEWDKEVIGGITAIGTPGHSFAHNPGWHAFYDQIPDQAEQTRRKIYDMLVAEKMPVQGFHYPFPAHAYVEKRGNGYQEIAVLWNPAI